MSTRVIYDGVEVRPGDVVWWGRGTPWYDTLNEVALVVQRNYRWMSRSMLTGLGPVSPRLWEELREVEAVWRQPWLRWYPPLVVDRDRLSMQIEALLDPSVALRTWVYDKFGIVVNPRQAEWIAAIERGDVYLPSPWKTLR